MENVAFVDGDQNDPRQGKVMVDQPTPLKHYHLEFDIFLTFLCQLLQVVHLQQLF